ncbi:amidase [Ferrovibrio sp. MS7]|jgi:aspartyl-tRNA(Asn)/glutamyl-tRNA(Gln) amidotransferase subunit A|uniref:amidase n=1 Tax=Ferrovibrio plantarum TaxID=3119164 RepID=UPI003136BE20
MAEAADLSVADAAALIARRALSAPELCDSYLARIARRDQRLNAYLHVDADAVRRAAATRQNLIDRSGPASPLDGIPIAVKDIIDVAGQRTSSHSAVTENHVASRDAAVVERLRENGAIILGKTALHEFAIGGPCFDLPWPPARNPWDVTRHPGGSSSGSGAAVAAGMAAAALGTDTAGSVRNPATCCGLYGLKPTAGAISRRGVFPLAFSLDAVGPITRRVEDMALIFAALAQPDPDPAGSRAHPHHGRLYPIAQGITGMTLGLVRRFHRDAPETEAVMAENFEQTAAAFAALGARLVEIDLPPLADWANCTRVIQQSEAYSIHRPWLESQPERYCAISRQKLLPGAFLRAIDYIEALKARRVLTAILDDAFSRCDVMLCVSSMTVPCRLDDPEAIRTTYEKQARLPFSLSGHPALAFPTGFTADGLPLGQQLVAPAWREDLLFRFAQTYEKAHPWHERRPPC